MASPRLLLPRLARSSPSCLVPLQRVFSLNPRQLDDSVINFSKTPPFNHSKRGHEAAVANGSVTQGGKDSMAGVRTGQFQDIGGEDIDVTRLVIEKISVPKPKQSPETLTFGKTFTDHMLTVPWSSTSGWGAPKISPYQPFVLDPSSTVFHYASCLFEGMKAYMGKDGRVRLFRPDMNMRRMNRSAARLAFPTFTGDHLTELMCKLVSLDSSWIPTLPGYSLYLRPTMIGTQPSVGVGPSSSVILFCILSPVGPYYPTGFKPISLLASTSDIRAWPGGSGSYKLGSNYASGIVPQMKAAAEGYQQILWLFGEDRELTEVGTMNLFVAFETPDGGTELVTPPLGDIILPGVTRDSILSLAKRHEEGELALEGMPPKGIFEVRERKITMGEVLKAAEKGKLKEVFGCGTAAVVSAVQTIGFEGKQINVPVGPEGLGQIASVMNREIVGRHTGDIESDWAVFAD